MPWATVSVRHRLFPLISCLCSDLYSVYEWTLNGTFAAKAKTPSVSWALVALACADVLALTSMNYFRRKAYRLFANTHVVGFAILLPAVRQFT